MQTQRISIIIPIFNEEKNLSPFYDALRPMISGTGYEWEIIFIDDGSTDDSDRVLGMLAAKDDRIRVVTFTRNFGKEAAMSAGIEHATGDACIVIDADLQHPVERIPDFLAAWQGGAEVVVGVRTENHGEGFVKRWGSRTFYAIMQRISDTDIMPHATDYRLIDRAVADAFLRLSEKNRLTRGLIDWLGFKTVQIPFAAREREHGEAGYSVQKLFRLALDSFTAHSLFPLRVAGYLGVIITCISAPLGLFILVEKYLLEDPLALNFTGTAMLAVFNMFLVGIVLVCLGLMSFYIASIHREVMGRPLYVIRKK